MNTSQRAALVQLMQRYTNKKSKSASTARAALIAEGIYTKKGKISAAYGGESLKKRPAKKG